MKKLILPLLLLSSSIYAADEIFTADDGKALVTLVEDVKVDDMLSKTSEFAKCRDENKFVAKDDDKEKTRKLKAAEDCFKKELAKNKDPKKLEQLADALNLQNYGLIKSKNVKEIQNYLNNKMYKAMTGVDRETMTEKQIVESLKFKNKKHIDQGTFIKLYKTQLTKNALFEISRFCFENLRDSSQPSTANSFSLHWKDFNGQQLPSTLDDSGSPKFGDTIDTTDKNTIYADIFKSIKNGNGGMSPDNLSAFFMLCGKAIVPLCQKFKTNTASQNIGNVKTQEEALAASTAVANGDEATTGAAACLAQSRIQDLKKALADADKIIEYYRTDMASNSDLANKLMQGVPVKNFGQDAGDESLDNLTNYTTADILEGGDENAQKDKIEKCSKASELPECEGFFSEGDDLAKVKHNVEMELTLKREVEMARVKEIKKMGQAKLEEYLKSNGYFDILKKLEQTPNMPDDELAKLIGAEFEAKKLATINEMNQKLGSRQVKKGELDDNALKLQAQENAKQSKEERARLAQVVLFNNIITSHLNLVKSNGESAGRNVNAFKKEESALQTAGVQDAYFSGLKGSGQSSGSAGAGQNDEFGGIGLIDQILGDESKAKSGTN